MNEIKCPKCGTQFQIDESDYESILKQVRDHEFEKQIQERQKLFETEKDNAIKLKIAEYDKEKQLLLSKKEEELLKLKTDLDNINKNKDIEIKNIKFDEEKKYKD